MNSKNAHKLREFMNAYIRTNAYVVFRALISLIVDKLEKKDGSDNWHFKRP